MPKRKRKKESPSQSSGDLSEWVPRRDSSGLLARAEDQSKVNPDQLDRDFDSLSHTKLWYARERAKTLADLKRAELHLDNVKKEVRGREQQRVISMGSPRSADTNLINFGLIKSEPYLQAQRNYVQALQDYEDARAACEAITDKIFLVTQIGADRRRR